MEADGRQIAMSVLGVNKSCPPFPPLEISLANVRGKTQGGGGGGTIGFGR